jgi:hypothetical protein
LGGYEYSWTKSIARLEGKQMQEEVDNPILKGDDFDLLEYRPSKFVKIINGDVVGIARDADIQAFKLSKSVSRVDTGVIQTALALGAISALLTSDNNNLLVRLIGMGGFVASSFSAGILYFYYISKMVPWLVTGKGSKIIFQRYFFLLRKFVFTRPTWKEENELAYLNLLAAFFLVWVGLFFWILFSFLIPK